MPNRDNRHIGDRLEEAAHLLREQGSDRFRVNAYLRAATVVRQWPEPLTEVFTKRGLDGLEALPGIGPTIARATSASQASGIRSRIALVGRADIRGPRPLCLR